MNTKLVMTFAEFLITAEANTMLIYPEDEETRDKNELGVIDYWGWRPISFTDAAKTAVGGMK